MTLAAIGGGQMLGNGSAEPMLFNQGAPTAKTAAATLTAAEIAAGFLTYTGAAANLTLPTVADLEAYLTMAQRKDLAFEFAVLDLAGAGRATIVTNTGWTLAGSMATTSNTCARFLARKTSNPGETAAWTLYRFGG